MSKLKTSCGFAAAAFVLVFASASANAQATRTWVSGVGDDFNPCSRISPCRTFAGAISKTAAGGQISTLDAGGFGTVTIKQSVSITNDNAGEAGILASGTSGVIVNVAKGEFVNLRGLIIDGGAPGDPGPGMTGVRFIGGGTLTIANSVIRNFVTDAATGVSFTPNASARLTIRDTHIVRNGLGAAGGGIVVKPTAGTSSVTLTRVTMDNNSNGLVVDTTSGAVFTSMLDSSTSANDNTGIALIGGAGATASFLALDRSASSNNANGVTSTGDSSSVLLTNSIVTGNNTGLTASSGGKIVSFGNNVFTGNVAKGAVTSTVTTE
jgi:hypothetical protein